MNSLKDKKIIMKKYQFITLALVVLSVVAAIPAQADEKGLFNNRKEFRQEKQAEMKARFTENRREIFSKKVENIFNHLDKAIIRLENASERISSRIAKIENEQDRDLNSAKEKLQESKNKISEVKNKIETKETEIKNLVNSESEIVFKDIQSAIKELREEIKVIKNLLIETLKLIK